MAPSTNLVGEKRMKWSYYSRVTENREIPSQQSHTSKFTNTALMDFAVKKFPGFWYISLCQQSEKVSVQS